MRTKTITPNQKTIRELRELVDTPKMIGAPEELIPFAWRNPLVIKKIKQTSRFLKNLDLEEAERNKKQL